MDLQTSPPTNVYFVSLGCPKNRVDSEVMLGLIDHAGYKIVAKPDTANVIVVNTCGFIEAAKEESIDTILEMAEFKDSGVCRKLVVAGCLSQRYPEQLAEEIPEIDHILGSADFADIVSVLEQEHKPTKRLPIVSVSKMPSYIYNHDAPRMRWGQGHSAYVKIAEGCDRPCSFCIIPALRGPQRSRSIDSIASEVTALIEQGVREVNLVAQDLTRYGADLAKPRPTLATLLETLAQLPGLGWLRLHYTYPTAFPDALIEVIARQPKIVKYIDVPLQHIDDGMLKSMRRGHSARVTYELIERLRNTIDELVLRTTFIVGHPGETEQAFARLCDFVAQSEFDHVGVFPYSQENGTVSAMLPNRVDPKIAQERRDHLMEIQRQISRRKHEAMVGRELEVLVDGVSDESEYLLSGRWYGQALEVDGVVYLADGSASPGDIVTAQVTDAADYDLAATIVGG